MWVMHSGYPPVFVIWRRSGGPSKSMYSKLSQVAVDAEPSWLWAGLPRPGQGIGREGLEEE